MNCFVKKSFFCFACALFVLLSVFFTGCEDPKNTKFLTGDQLCAYMNRYFPGRFTVVSADSEMSRYTAGTFATLECMLPEGMQTSDGRTVFNVRVADYMTWSEWWTHYPVSTDYYCEFYKADIRKYMRNIFDKVNLYGPKKLYEDDEFFVFCDFRNRSGTSSKMISARKHYQNVRAYLDENPYTFDAYVILREEPPKRIDEETLGLNSARYEQLRKNFIRKIEKGNEEFEPFYNSVNDPLAQTMAAYRISPDLMSVEKLKSYSDSDETFDSLYWEFLTHENYENELVTWEYF